MPITDTLHPEAVRAFRGHAAYCARSIPAAAEWVALCDRALAGEPVACGLVGAAIDALDYPWN